MMTTSLPRPRPASLPVPGASDTQRWLYLDEAAHELRVSTKTVRRWAAAGQIHARYIGTARIIVDILSASRPMHGTTRARARTQS